MSVDFFTLRAAQAADALVVRRLVLAAGLNPLSLNWRRFLLAVDGAGTVVACAQIRPHRDGSLELASVVVRETWRSRGVAGALIRQLQTAAGPPLWLTCRASLVGFYQRFGFRQVGAGEPQPAYFRRVRNLVNSVRRWSGRDDTLAVMAWERAAAV